MKPCGDSPKVQSIGILIMEDHPSDKNKP